MHHGDNYYATLRVAAPSPPQAPPRKDEEPGLEAPPKVVNNPYPDYEGSTIFEEASEPAPHVIIIQL